MRYFGGNQPPVRPGSILLEHYVSDRELEYHGAALNKYKWRFSPCRMKSIGSPPVQPDLMSVCRLAGCATTVIQQRSSDSRKEKGEGACALKVIKDEELISV